MTTKFIRKPVIIEAEQFTFENRERVFSFIKCNYSFDTDKEFNPVINIQTLEGIITASLGDWIIKGIEGEFYPCKPDIFEKTYSLVDY